MELFVWQAIRISYYDEHKDDLILEAARPLLERLRDDVRRAYFLRHWRQGPHLLIPVESTPAAMRSVVAPAVEEILGPYLAARPSNTALMPEPQLLPMHQRLAEMEQEERPLRPLLPDNQISFEDHDRRLSTLGGPTGADLLADFYTATNDLAFRMLERIRAGLSREALSLSLMVAVAHSYCGEPPNISSGFVSFRSHAEAFLHHCTDPGATRVAFDRRYQANRGALARLTEKVLNNLDGHTNDAAFVLDWVEVLRAFWSRSAAMVASGELGPPPSDRDGGRGERGPSPMHKMMLESSAIRAQIFDDPLFKRYRLMLNYTYLHLARIGITAYARYLLCHLAANAVEDVLGLDALAMIERIATAPAAGISPALAGPIAES